MSGSDAPLRARRDFLKYATIGTGLAGVGLATKGMLGAMGTTQDVTFAVRPTEFDLTTLAEGEVAKLDVGWSFVLQILHRSPTQIAAAMEVSPDQLNDRLARNQNFPRDSQALAYDENRRATPDGKFVVVSGSCWLDGFRLLGKTGDFDGWFCPGCSTHFDNAGRSRKGRGPRNLTVPAMTVISNRRLLIYQQPHMKPVI